MGHRAWCKLCPSPRARGSSQGVYPGLLLLSADSSVCPWTGALPGCCLAGALRAVSQWSPARPSSCCLLSTRPALCHPPGASQPLLSPICSTGWGVTGLASPVGVGAGSLYLPWCQSAHQQCWYPEAVQAGGGGRGAPGGAGAGSPSEALGLPALGLSFPI